MSNEEKPTVEIAQVPDWAVKLTEKVVGGFTRVEARLDGLEGTDRTLTDKVNDMGVDIRQLRDADVRHEEEFRRLSVRTKDASATASSASLEHEAKLGIVMGQLAEEKAKTAALEANGASKDDVKRMLDDAAKEQTAAIVTAVDTLVKTPTAQKLKGAIVPVLMTAIAIIGFKLTMLMTKLQESPPVSQTIVQMQGAPIADAGADR